MKLAIFLLSLLFSSHAFATASIVCRTQEKAKQPVAMSFSVGSGQSVLWTSIVIESEGKKWTFSEPNKRLDKLKRNVQASFLAGYSLQDEIRIVLLDGDANLLKLFLKTSGPADKSIGTLELRDVIKPGALVIQVQCHQEG